MNRVRRFLLVAVLLLPGGWSPAMTQNQDLPSGYVAIAPLVVPVVDNFRMPAVLMTRLTIEAPDPEMRQKLEIVRPRLIDAYVRELMNFGRLRVDPSRPVNVERLAAVLQAATDKVTENGKARVLILEAAVGRR